MGMYNKIFTKILDSSIWLEPDATRLVWLTLIAAMDEDGFCQFASVANLAHRARVTLEGAGEAVKVLEGPDDNSSDPDNEGRRIERIPGGWIVLNAKKYRELVTRTVIKEQTRARVARHRAKRTGNAEKRECNVAVTQSDTDTKAETSSKEDGKEDEKEESKDIVELFRVEWNKLPTPFQRIRAMTESRKKTLRTRMKDAQWKEEWRKALWLLPERPFCRGENDRGWIADPEFFLRPDTVNNLIEGKYSGGKTSAQKEPELPDRTEELGPCNTDEVFAALKARMNAPKISPLQSFKLQ